MSWWLRGNRFGRAEIVVADPTAPEVVATGTASGLLRTTGRVVLPPLSGAERRLELLGRPLPMVALCLAVTAMCVVIAVAPQDHRGLPAGVVQTFAIVGIPVSIVATAVSVRRWIQERRRGRRA